MISHSLAAGMAFLVLASTCGAAETVESPLYKSWSRSKVGTTVTLKSVTIMNGQTIESTMRYRLVALAPEKAIVELVVTSKGIDGLPQKIDYRRDFPLLPGMKKEDIGKPPGASEQGEETLKVAGQDYKTRWYILKGQTEAGESIARTWTTSDFPGMMLKSVIKVAAANKVTTLEVVEINAP